MKLLITGAWKDFDNHYHELLKLGFDIIYCENEFDDAKFDESSIDAAICNNFFTYHSVKKFKSLKFVQLTSTGLDRIDLEDFNKQGIVVRAARGVYSIPISECVIAGILYFYKHLNVFDENKRNKKWLKDRSLLELNNKNACIIGCGMIGQECAKKLNIFGCNVFGMDSKDIQLDGFTKIIRFEKSNLKMLRNMDIVIICVPLTEENKGMCNNDFFLEMKENSLFVNVSRGKIVVEKDLIHALKTRLNGAVLDVYEHEPLEESNELWSVNNVLLLPHNAFVSDGNDDRLWELILSNLKEYLGLHKE